jgi:hypothetical protein
MASSRILSNPHEQRGRGFVEIPHNLTKSEIEGGVGLTKNIPNQNRIEASKQISKIGGTKNRQHTF